MSDLPAKTGSAIINFSVEDGRAADACAEKRAEHVGTTLRCAELMLAVESHMNVVVDCLSCFNCPPEMFANGIVCEADQIWRSYDSAIRLVNGARATDSNAGYLEF